MMRTFSLALIAAAAVAPSANAFAPSTTLACKSTHCQDTFSRFSSKVFMSDDDDVSNKMCSSLGAAICCSALFLIHCAHSFLFL